MSARPLRIVYFSDAPYFGGAEEYLLMLAGALDKGRFAPKLFLWHKARRIDEFEERLAKSGIPSVRHHFGKEVSAKDISDLWRMMRKEKPDILHINLPSTYDAAGGLVAVVGKLAGVRAVVFTEHLPSLGRHIRMYPMKKVSLLIAGRVITVCDATRKALLEQQGGKPSVTVTIHNGIEEAPPVEEEERRKLRLELGLGDGYPLLGAVGELSPRKGHIHLLSALVRIVPDWPDTVLAIAGEGELLSFLIESAKKLGVDKNVRLLGRRKDTRKFLSLIDLFVLPSLHEGLPYVVMEAMAAGKPVIAAAVNGLPEMVEDGVTGLLVQPRDTDGLSRAVSKLAGDRELALRMGKSARQRFVERFTLRDSVAKTEQVYADVLKSKGVLP